MKKLFYSLAVVLFAATFASCDKNDHDDFGTSAKQDIEVRADALGFDDVAAYKASVAEQCAAGNHENCDTYKDGTHEACAYSDHSGKNHDGTPLQFFQRFGITKKSLVPVSNLDKIYRLMHAFNDRCNGVIFC